MNKSEFIQELENKSGYTAEQCAVINGVLEDHFIFRKKNKPKVVASLSERLNVDAEEAEKIYALAMDIINAEIKKSKRHPFGSGR